ncbi:MAG: hypothetical protein LW835_16915 [Burkholderiaceae bacterium]|nr:hypothetical protein [Burkholderiaceae bacterium]
MQPSLPIPWSRREGRLSLADRWGIALGAVRTRLAARRRGPFMPIELNARALDSIVPPADAVSRAVLGFAADAQPAWLLQHALRTYAWGRLLALNGDWAHEAKVLYAASLLHDLGLTSAAAEPADGCFAVRGARAAQQVLTQAGAGTTEAHRVACAIALHLDLTVGRQRGVEAHLLSAGAGLDVVGRRSRELAPALMQAVLARHPRLAMKRELCACMRREAQAAPHTRMGLYVGRFGFLDLIEKAPFDE